MDVVLDVCDHHFFTPYVYPDWIPQDNAWRQLVTLLVVVNINAAILYLSTAGFSYYVIFDHKLLKHPQILENQVSREIKYALHSIPFMSLPTCLLFLLEVRGYSKLYDEVGDSKYGWWMVAGTVVTFILFTDFMIYWIHRWLHHRLVYKHVHKPHHWWKVPTPFASHAFHPIDGFLQSVPYHLYVFLFPLHKLTYLVLFVCVNIWTVSIHDGDFRVPAVLKPIINGSAHHMDHHLYYNYNYGQYFTLWDRLGGSFRNPSSFEGDGPLDYIDQLEREGKLNKHTDVANGHAKTQ